VTQESESSPEKSHTGHPLRELALQFLPVFLIVGAILMGVDHWLSGGGVGGEEGRVSDGPGGDRAGNPGEEIGFHPKPGDYVLLVDIEGSPTQSQPLSIHPNDDSSYRVMTWYWPPEPQVVPLPALLEAHLGKIPLRIDIGDGGHLIDVTGPDRYFDTLDEVTEGASDPIRALLLEEQVDAHYKWTLTSIISRTLAVDETWTTEQSLRGFGNNPSWTGVLRYQVGPPRECSPPSSSEPCIPIMVTTEESSNESSLEGSILIGEATGLSWNSEFLFVDSGNKRRVRTRLKLR
jgi:hypothetical protein